MRSGGRDLSAARVALCIDTTSIYGRGLLSGIAAYVETYRSWSLFIDANATGHYARDWLRNWQGDGFLGFIKDPAMVQQLHRARIPAVLAYDSDLPLPQVGNDNFAIGRLAAEYLIERRFKHFAFSGFPAEVWSRRRQHGFTAAVAQAGVVHPSLAGVRRPKTLAESERHLSHLTDWVRQLPKPVGIMACSDRQGQRVLVACQRAGVAVPEEAAVIGVDNDEDICLLADPPLTSMQTNERQIGYQAAALLNQIMSGSVAADRLEPVLVPPVGIIPRRSTDITATSDRLVAQAARLIYQRACQGLTVKQLLQELNVSRSQFYRRFASVLGRSPHEHILHVRLERVKGLLAQTTLPLEKIAELAGFEHPEYLNVAFKREVGIPPGKYRRQQGRKGLAGR
jgi:LacI family transcriptional regulator